MESEIRNAFELRNTVQGTRNSSSPDKEPGSTTWNPESTTSESKTVLVSFNGVTLHAWQISLGYSTRMELWRLQCWRQSLLKWTMKRKTYLCLFLLKHQWKQETFVFITFSSFRKVNFYSKICWFPVFIWFRSLPVAYTTKRKHWPRLINNFNRKMSMRLLYYPEIWRKTAKKFQNRWPEL